MDNRPIGIFDSGLGGLTAVREILQIMPHEQVVYFGDTGRVPYGTRSRETIIKYARQDIAFLLSKQVKIVIAACGTVSSVAAGLGQEIPVLYTGVVEPTALAASLATRNQRVGVIGTSATIQSGSYRRALNALNLDIQVFEPDCPLFVPLVEHGFSRKDDPVPRLVAERYLAPLKEHGIDTLIMGCTHYPILRDIIAQIMGKDVTLIDSGRETASFASEMLRSQNALCDETQTAAYSFFVSDRVEGFSKAASVFLEQNIVQDVQYINIDAFAKDP